MRFTMRASVAALALCVALGPAVLDACVLSCESGPGRIAATPVPACHQHRGVAIGADANASHVRESVGSRPLPCGHDHHALAATPTAVRAVDAAHGSGVAGPLATAASMPREIASRVIPRARSHCIDPGTHQLTPLRV